MLCVSIGTWAQSVSGPTGGTLYFENFSDPSQLASVLLKQQTVGTSEKIDDEGTTKLYFKNCTIDNAVLAALQNATYATLIDMDRAQFADAVDLSNLSTPAAEYITLPFGSTVSDMKEISTSSCPKLKAVASMDKEPAENAYFYEFQEESLSGFISANIINSDNGLKAASSFHFGGNVGSADVDYIKGNIANSQKTHLLDFSDATVTDANLKNLAGANGYTENWVAQRISQVVVLPTTPTPSDDLKSTFQNGGWSSPAYQTYAYYTDETKKELSVFCESDNNCNDLPYLTPLVTDDMTLSFDKWTNNSYLAPNHDKFFAGLNGFPVGNIDFSNINISSLGTDFSGLNAATHYITIATANKDNSGNVKPDMDNVGPSGYNYGSNIYAVSTFKEPGNNNNNYVNYSGISYNPINSTNDNTLITYVTAAGAGKLSGAKNFLSEKQKSAKRMNVIGTLNAADVAALGDVPVEKLDLMYATISDADMASLKSKTVKYLALPDGKASLMGVTSADDYSFKTSCPALLCVGSYDPTSNVYSTYSSKNLGEDGKQISSVNVVTRMIKPVYNTTAADRMNKNSSFCSGLESVVMSGYLNLDDINTSNGVDLAGLSSGTIKHGDLTNAIFPTATDMSFLGSEDNGHPGAGWSLTTTGNGASLILPVSSQVTMIPPYSLWNAKGLTTICIPGNIKYIEEGAFGENINWNTIYTTEVDGNGDGRGNAVGDDRANSITLPAALLHIGTSAFWNAEQIYDVYSTSTDHVPACDQDAFSAGTYTGWGGAALQGDGYAIRSEFQRFGVLHWPDDLTLDQIKMYTDITRVYSYPDRDGVTDDRGNILMWPSQAEFNKSHGQAINNYTWEAWADAETLGLSGPDVDESTAASLYASNGSPSNVTYENYIGWHQFVLTANWSHSKKYVEKSWNTICIPYNVTFDQLKKIYGVLPPGTKTVGTGSSAVTVHEIVNLVDENGEKIRELSESDDALLPTVSTLTSVNRKVTYKKNKNGEYVLQDNGSYKKMTAEQLKTVDPAKRYVAGNGLITLQFTEGMVTKAATEGKVYNWQINSDYTWSAESSSLETGEWVENTDGIIMKAGYPYHLKVYVPLGTENIRTYALNELESAGATTSSTNTPYDEWIVPTTGSAGGDELKYKFKGYYDVSASAVALPMYCYFLWVPKSGESLWYRYDQSWGEEWGQKNPIASYAAIIGLIAEDGKTWPEYDLMLTDKTSGAQAKATFGISFGEDEMETTGIRDIQNDSNLQNVPTGRVYNMNGQVVKENGSLQGLGKGLYIINGKKYIVK